MTREELASWLRLTLTPGVGGDAARRLLAAFGLPAAIWSQPEAALRQLVTPAQARALLTEPDSLAALLDTSWRWLQTAPTEGVGRAIVTLADPNYPASLLAIEDPPLLVYLLGQTEAWTRTSSAGIAVVGSRNPTPQGVANARQFAQTLAAAGLTVVSGLALGVDGAAHVGALDGAAPGQLATIAVVGTGLDRVYPKQHRDLAHRIAMRGLLVSEYPLGTPPIPANFPRRNRIISGLSLGTLVVEAALRSGSLITARLAGEHGKEVFAIPGSIHAPQARGCHALIKQGAKLVESAQDVLEELRLPQARSLADTAGPDDSVPAPQMPGDALLDGLGHDPVGLDALQARTGLDTATLQARLLTLELEGLVGRLPGGLFQRLVPA